MAKIDRTHQEKIFLDNIGQKATIKRETLGGDRADIANRLLCDLGLSFAVTAKHLEHYRYLGSAAVHIYVNDTLAQLDIITQAEPLERYRCTEVVASKACDDLIREIQKRFGRTKGKLRSGF